MSYLFHSVSELPSRPQHWNAQTVGRLSPPPPARARQPPNALVVHLKRFAVQGRRLTKMKTQIGFGESLAVKVSGPEGRAVYDLTGCVQRRRVVCHTVTPDPSCHCRKPKIFICPVCEEEVSNILCVFTTSTKC